MGRRIQNQILTKGKHSDQKMSQYFAGSRYLLKMAMSSTSNLSVSYFISNRDTVPPHVGSASSKLLKRRWREERLTAKKRRMRLRSRENGFSTPLGMTAAGLPNQRSLSIRASSVTRMRLRHDFRRTRSA